MAETTEILNIEVNVGEAVKQIEQYKARIAEIKKSQADLKKQLKEGQISFDEYTDAVASTTVELQTTQTALKDTQKELQNSITANTENERSLRAMRAELSNLTLAYDKMSEAQRNAAEGQALQQQMKSLSDEIKGLEEDTGRFYRNVGNYEEAIKNALGSMNPFVAGLMDIQKQSEEVGEEMAQSGQNVTKMGAFFKTAGMQVKAFGKSLLSLLANPVVAIIAAIALAIMGVVKAIQSSEEQTQRLQVLFAPLQRGLDALLAMFQKLAGGIISIIEVGAEWISSLSKWAEKLPFVGNAIAKMNEENEKAILLEKDKIALTHRERDALVETANIDYQVSELKAKAAEKDKYTAKERQAFINQALDLERKKADEEIAIAEERFRIAKAEADRNQNDAEANQQLAEMQADIIRKRTDYNNKVRELYAQRVEAGNMVIAEEKAQAEAEKKIIEERKKVIEEQEKIIAESEKYLITVMEDGVEKQKKLLQLEYKEQKKALEDKLQAMRDNGTLTIEVEAAINAQLKAMEQKHNADLLQIDKDATAKKIEEEKKRIEEETKLKKEALQKEMDDKKAQYETELIAMELANDDQLAIEKRKLEQKKEMYESAQQQEGETTAQFNLRKIKLEQEYNQQLQTVKNMEIQIRVNAANAVGQIFGAMGQMLDAAGENNLAAVKLQQTLAIVEVMISQGIAIAMAIKTAVSSSFTIWDMIANIATAVATVTTTMATAIKTIKSTKEQIAEAEAQKAQSAGASSVKGYATGGLVTGAGTGTSDSIPAMLSNGEFVIPASTYKAFSGIIDPIYRMGQHTNPNVSSVSASVSQRNAGNDALSKAFAKGASEIHPQVSVVEINAKQSRVAAIERRARR